MQTVTHWTLADEEIPERGSETKHKHVTGRQCCQIGPVWAVHLAQSGNTAGATSASN